MRRSLGTWPILLFGLLSLLALIVFSAVAGASMAAKSYQEMAAIHRTHQAFDQALSQLKSHIFLTSIYLRDFLLDPSNANSDFYRQELRKSQSAAEFQLTQIKSLRVISRKGV